MIMVGGIGGQGICRSSQIIIKAMIGSGGGGAAATGVFPFYLTRQAVLPSHLLGSPVEIGHKVFGILIAYIFYGKALKVIVVKSLCCRLLLPISGILAWVATGHSLPLLLSYLVFADVIVVIDFFLLWSNPLLAVSLFYSRTATHEKRAFGDPDKLHPQLVRERRRRVIFVVTARRGAEAALAAVSGSQEEGQHAHQGGQGETGKGGRRSTRLMRRAPILNGNF